MRICLTNGTFLSDYKILKNEFKLIDVFDICKKNDFNFALNDYTIIYDLISEELSTNEDDVAVIGNSFYDLNGFKLLIYKLSLHSLVVTDLVVPSVESINLALEHAIKENQNDRFGGIRVQDIINEYKKYETNLNEIINHARDLSINIKRI